MRFFLFSLCLLLLGLQFSSSTNFTEKYATEKTAIVKDDSITKSYRLHNLSLLETNTQSQTCYILNFENLNQEVTPVDFTNIFEFSCYLQSTEDISIELTLISIDNEKSNISKTVFFDIDKTDGSYKQLIFHVPLMESNNLNDLSNITNIEINVYAKDKDKTISFIMDELTFSYLGKDDMFLAEEFAYNKNEINVIYGEYLEEKRIEGWGHQHKIASQKNRD